MSLSATWNMPEGPVVLNNTPLVAFWAIGRLDLLRDLFGEALIPQAVQAEFLAMERSSRERALAEATWIRSVTLAPSLAGSGIYGPGPRRGRSLGLWPRKGAPGS